MRTIITGGTGLIGKALANCLAQAGHEVIILTRNPQKQVKGLPASARLVGWDARTVAGWGALADEAQAGGPVAIVNLAGENLAGETFKDVVFKRWTDRQKERILHSRLNAGKAIVEAVQAAAQKPRILVQASAVGYYGSRGDEILSESVSTGNDYVADVVRQWEASTSPVEALGVRRAVVRTAGVVMSLAGGALPFMMLPFKFFAGGPLGSGKQWLSWIHISDEVQAIRFLIENEQARGVFNVCTPQPVRNHEFSKALGRAMKRPAFFPTPAFLIRMLTGEKADVLLASQRQIPQRLQELGFQWKYPTVEAALSELFHHQAA
jgi:uncharacterized protein (TIGR01777 family)